MKREQISDALGLLPDDMIRETEYVRKNPGKHKRRPIEGKNGMIQKKSVVWALCTACVLILALGCTLFLLDNQTDQNELREKYPLIREADYMMDDPGFSFEERIAIAPNIVEIKVIKKLPDHSVFVGDEAYGVSKEVIFCQYQVKLISNISNTNIVTDTDNTFVLTFAKDLAQSYPVLEDNLEAICSIEAASGVHEGKYILYDRSFYYVDDQTVLSAYEGDDSPASKMCAKETFVQQIKAIRSK